MKNCFKTTCALFALSALTVSAADIYVSTNNIREVDGLLRGSHHGREAYVSIPEAIAAASAGDTVWVDAGTYVLSEEIAVTNAITVRGLNKFLTQIVSDGGSHRLFSLSGEAVLSDVTLAGARANVLGGAIAISGGAELRDSVVRDSRSTAHGGGIYLTTGAVRRTVVVDCSTTGAQTWGGGLTADAGTGIIENSLFVNGYASGWGGNAYIDAAWNGTVLNSTFFGGACGVATSDLYCYSGNAVLKNSRFVRGGNKGTVQKTTDVAYGFVAPSRANLRLDATSPLINAGSAVEEGYTDLDGVPVDDSVSIGCYQRRTPDGSYATLEFSSSAIALGGTVTVTPHFPASAAVTEGTLYMVGQDGGIVGSYSVTDGTPIEITVNNAGYSSFALMAGEETVVSAFAPLFCAYAAVYMDSASANPAAPYSTPGTAARTIAEALKYVADNGIVYVADGEHPVSETVVLDSAVKILGENGRDSAVLLGGNVRMFTLNHPQSVLSSLTLRGSGSLVRVTGAAVLMNEGLIEDCVLENFVGGECGAISVPRLGRIERSLIRNNTSSDQYAGGVLIGPTGRADIRNTIFTGNHASQNWGHGVYAFGAGSIVNCTFFGNSTTGGELCRDSNYLAVTNCIFGSVSYYRGGATLRSCNIDNATADLFVDAASGDFRLKETSVTAIDQGDLSAVFEGDRDAYGQKRVVGEGVDIGALEYQTGAFSASFEVVGTPSAIGDSVLLVPTVAGGSNPVNSWRIVNEADGTEITGTTSGAGTNAAFEVTFANPGCYSYYWSVSDGSESAAASLPAYSVIFATNDLYVAETGTPVAPYDTPAKALTDVVIAAKIAAAGVKIYVGPGRYSINERIVLDRAVEFIGSGTDKTQLVAPDGADVGVMTLADAEARAASFAATGVFSVLYRGGEGAVVRVEAGLLEDALITNVVCNANVDGTAVALLESSARASRVTIANCKGGQYGTLFIRAGGVADNCLIYGCEAKGDYGDALYIDRSGTFSGMIPVGFVTNCTFVGNARRRTVYVYGNTGSKIVNTIIDGTFQGQGVEKTHGMFLNCVYTAGTSCEEDGEVVKVDSPGFVDSANGNFRLTKDSPCVGAGLYERYMRDMLDLDGKRRATRGMVDIGCYQRQRSDSSLFMIK